MGQSRAVGRPRAEASGSERARPSVESVAIGTGSLVDVATNHVRALDGLRGVAVLAVLAYHAGFGWAGGGFLGVSLFFTLSGFLVGTIVLREIDTSGGLDLKRFWARRFRRLLPAAMIALIGALVFALTVATPGQARVVPGHVAAALLNVGNWVYIEQDTGYVGLFEQPSPLLHFWSLAIEEQFYLLLPVVLLFAVRRIRSRRTLAVIVAASWVGAALWSSRVADVEGFERAYFGTDTRLSELLAGLLLAVVTSRPRKLPHLVDRAIPWAGTVAALVALIFMARMSTDDSVLWHGGMVVFSLAVVTVLVAAIRGGGPLRSLDLPPLRVTGRISYGLYLYHFPVFLWLTPERVALGPWPLFALRLAVTYLAAFASHRFVEAPIRSGASVGLRPPLRAPSYVLCAVSVAAAGFVLVDRSPVPTTFGEEQQAMPDVDADDGFQILVITDDAGTPVADALAARAATEASTTVVRAPLPACHAPGPELARDGCTDWAATWQPLIEQHDPDVVLLFLNRWPGGEPSPTVPLPQATASVRSAMVRALDVLSARGAPVVWSRMGADAEETQRRDVDPFHVAMTALLPVRDDLRNSVLWKPATAGTDYLADLLMDKLSTQRRRDAARRVMVVGDSQAQSVSYGLEHWSAENHGPVVWSAAKGGCSLTRPDRQLSLYEDGEEPINPACAAVVPGFRDSVERFDPDLVLVLSSLRDLQSVQLNGWNDFKAAGTPEFDDFLVDSYVQVVDALSASGAEVVWFLPPCLEFVNVLGGSDERPEAFDPARLDHLREVILPRLAAVRPDQVRLFDLGAHLCPDGEFLGSVPSVGAVRPDGIHLTPASTNWLAERIAPDLFAALIDDGGGDAED